MSLFHVGFRLDYVLSAKEFMYLEAALKEARGHKTKASQLLGINRTTLVEKLRRYQLLDKYPPINRKKKK